MEYVPGTWYPIGEDALTGERVLLWLTPHEIEMPFAWTDGRWMGDDFPLSMARPTHWSPIPKPPLVGEGS